MALLHVTYQGVFVSRKHNTKHARKRSNYPQRLLRRGESAVSVRMTPLAVLRERARRNGAVNVSNDTVDG